MSVKFISLFIINILCILQIDSSGDLKQDSKFDFEKQLFEKVLKMDSKMDTWEINLSKNNDDVKSALEKFEKMTKEISDVKNSMSELKQQFNIMIQDSKDKFENVIDDVRKEKDRMLQIVREETSNTISTFKKEEGRLINKSKEMMHNYRNGMDNLMIELRTESEEINSITKLNVSSALSHVIHEAKNTLHHNKRHMDNIIKEMRQEAGIVLGNIKADVSDIMTQVEKETQKMINSTKTANGLYYPCNSSLDCKHPLGCHCGMCKCESGKDWNGQLCITKKKHKEICNGNCECSERLVCNNGLCSCEEIEYWDGHKCLARKTHQEECISSKECNETLVCSNGICKCNTIEYWNGNRCLAKKTHEERCFSSKECSDTLLCTNGLCICTTMAYWDRNKCLARKTYQEICSNSKECNDQLVCKNGFCNCNTMNYWDGTNCLAKKTHQEVCSHSKECSDQLMCSTGFCKCNTINYWDGTNCLAKKSLNGSCISNVECSELQKCKNNRCKCHQSYWTGETCIENKGPYECADLPITSSGVHTIYPLSDNSPKKAYCVVRDGTKWTVIQHRFDGSVNFSRRWSDYKSGFGDPSGEHWLGNEYIHAVSSRGHHKLLVVLTHQTGSDFYAQYSKFLVNDEHSNYLLKVTGYSGTAGDSLDRVGDGRANGQMFSTTDRDNDRWSSDNCARYNKSGWWYAHCSWSNLNKWPGNWYYNLGWNTIKSSYMMIART